MMLVKMFFTLIISFSLISMPVMAQDPTPTATPEPVATSEQVDMGEANDIMNNVTSSAGRDLKGDEGEGYLELLTMIAIAFIGWDLLKYCSLLEPMLFSPHLYMASAAGIISAEISSWIRYGEVNDYIEKINNATPEEGETDVQLKKFKITLDALKAERDIVKDKKTIVQWSTIGFYTATTWAGVEIIYAIKNKKDRDMSCNGSSGDSGTTIENNADVNAGQPTALYKQLEQTPSLIDSQFLLKEYQSLSSGKNISPSIDEYEKYKEIYQQPFKEGKFQEEKIHFGKYMALLMGFINPISSAHAEFKMTAELYKTIGIVGAVWLHFKLIKKTSESFVINLMDTPWKRMVVFGAISALSQLNVSFLQKDLDRIDANIATIQKTIDSFGDPDDTGIKEGGGVEKEVVYDLPPYEFKYEDPNFLDHACTKSVSSSSLLVNCRDCKNGDRCGPVDPAVLKGPGFNRAPGALQSLASNTITGGSNMGQGNFSSVLASSDQLDGQSATLKKLKDKINDEINRLQKKNGKRPIDFGAESNKLLSSLQSSIRKSRNKALSSGQIPPLSKTSPLSSMGKGGSTENYQTSGSQATPQIKTGQASTDGTFDNLDLGGQPPQEEFVREDTNIEDVEGLKAFGLEDIRKDKSQNIFKVISLRYFQSYERLLEEMPTQPETGK